MYCLNLYKANVLTIFQGKDKYPSIFVLYRLTVSWGKKETMLGGKGVTFEKSFTG